MYNAQNVQGQKYAAGPEEEGRVISMPSGGENHPEKKIWELRFKDRYNAQFYPLDLNHVPGTLYLRFSLHQKSRVVISCVAEN